MVLSLDQIGPVAKDVSDCAAILERWQDRIQKTAPVAGAAAYDFTSALVDDVKGMHGVPQSYLGRTGPGGKGSSAGHWPG